MSHAREFIYRLPFAVAALLISTVALVWWSAPAGPDVTTIAAAYGAEPLAVTGGE